VPTAPLREIILSDMPDIIGKLVRCCLIGFAQALPVNLPMAATLAGQGGEIISAILAG